MQIIEIVKPEDRYYDFMAMEPGVGKRIHYYKNIERHVFGDASLKIDGDTIYYSCTTFKIARSKDGYYRKIKDKSGFTFKDRKIKCWFGKSIDSLPNLYEVLVKLGYNWIPIKLMAFCNKTIIEKIFNNKVTNPRDYCKAYLKIARIQASPAKFLAAIESGMLNHKAQLYSIADVAKNMDHYFDYIMGDNKRSFLYMPDFERQARMLDKKIDYTWSEKRMQEEHNNWTEEIMEQEVKSIVDYQMTYPDELYKFAPAGFTLLDTLKKVFFEGREMHHCVYTNYWDKVRAEKYLVYHIDNGVEVATLGIEISYGIFQYNQCTSKYNKLISSELLEQCQSFVRSLNNLKNEFESLKELTTRFRGYTSQHSEPVQNDFELLDF